MIKSTGPWFKMCAWPGFVFMLGSALYIGIDLATWLRQMDSTPVYVILYAAGIFFMIVGQFGIFKLAKERHLQKLNKS